MKKENIVIISVCLVLFASAVLTFTESVPTDHVDSSPTRDEPPEIVEVSTSYASKVLRNLTLPSLIEYSDMVAIVEVTDEVLTLSEKEKLPKTIVGAKVIKLIKGDNEDSILIVTNAGFMNEQTRIVFEGEPDLQKGTTWLLFMTKVSEIDGYETDIAECYHPIAPTSIQIVDGMTVTPIDNYESLMPKMDIVNKPVESLDIYMSP